MSLPAHFPTMRAPAGVVIDTFSNVLRTRPELLKPLIDGGAGLRDNDKFAQFARSHFALWACSSTWPRNVALDGPNRRSLERGRARRGWSRARLSASAKTHRLRYLRSRSSDQRRTPRPTRSRACGWGTSEIHLGRGAICRSPA